MFFCEKHVQGQRKKKAERKILLTMFKCISSRLDLTKI